jgi:hypothetical protein
VKQASVFFNCRIKCVKILKHLLQIKKFVENIHAIVTLLETAFEDPGYHFAMNACEAQ